MSTSREQAAFAARPSIRTMCAMLNEGYLAWDERLITNAHWRQFYVEPAQRFLSQLTEACK